MDALRAAHRYCKGRSKRFEEFKDGDFVIKIATILGRKTIQIIYADDDLLPEIRRIAMGWDCDMRGPFGTGSKQMLLTPSLQ